MRPTVLMLLCLAVAASAAAGDEFTLGLVNLPLAAITAVDDGKGLPEGDGIEVELTDDSHEALVFRASFTPTSESEFRLVLWNSPMGRLYYDRAEAEAMLGREGLVHGGHGLGVGLATAAIGDGSSSGLGFLLKGGSWSELPPGEKFAVAAEASIVAAILYGLVEMAD